MGLLGGLLSRRKPAAEPKARGQRRPGLLSRMIRAGFDSAQTTDDNRRHWANADGLSADAAASPDVRQTLRNRARYEVQNNCYARGVVSTLANDTIGAGPRLQVLTKDPEVNNAIESIFAAWAREIRLARKLRTMRMARATDGESFLILARNNELRSKIKLDIRIVEADQIATPDRNIWAQNLTDGIVFDEFGNPTEYHLLREHPGASGSGISRWGEYDPIPAENVIHYFREDRPGQSRGIPEIAPALPLCSMLRRYTIAVLGAAETVADWAGLLYTDAPPDGADPGEAFETVELERRMLVTAPAGWRMEQIKAEQPTTTYGDFKGEVINEFARCFSMPFNIAAGNSSTYNYASGRLDHQTYYRVLDVERSEIEATVLDRIFERILEMAVLVSDLLEIKVRTAIAKLNPHEIERQWFWPGHQHVDPAKEASAQAQRLASHTTTLAAEYAKQGLDWEQELRQRAKEKALMEELGLTAAPVAPGNDNEDDEEEVPAGKGARGG